MFYSRQHYRRVSPKADTREEIAARLVRNARLAQIQAELNAKFPVITLKNAAEAIAYQQQLLNSFNSTKP